MGSGQRWGLGCRSDSGKVKSKAHWSGEMVLSPRRRMGVSSLFNAFGEVEGRLFEEKAIGDDDIGLGEGLGYRRGGFVSMRVGSLGDNALEVDAGAADVLDDAGDRVRRWSLRGACRGRGDGWT